MSGDSDSAMRQNATSAGISEIPSNHPYLTQPFAALDTLFEVYGLGDAREVKTLAARHYMEGLDRNFASTRSYQRAANVAVYSAIRVIGIPITLPEFAGMFPGDFGENRAKLGSDYNELHSLLSLTEKDLGPKDFVKRLSFQTGVSERTAQRTMEIIDKAEGRKAFFAINTSPVKVTAVCMYAASLMEQEGKTMVNFASASGFSTGTIESAFRILKIELDGLGLHTTTVNNRSHRAASKHAQTVPAYSEAGQPLPPIQPDIPDSREPKPPEPPHLRDDSSPVQPDAREQSQAMGRDVAEGLKTGRDKKEVIDEIGKVQLGSLPEELRGPAMKLASETDFATLSELLGKNPPSTRAMTFAYIYLAGKGTEYESGLLKRASNEAQVRNHVIRDTAEAITMSKTGSKVALKA